jgi:hypothetical protein
MAARNFLRLLQAPANAGFRPQYRQQLDGKNRTASLVYRLMASPALFGVAIRFGQTSLEIKLPGSARESYPHRAKAAIVFVGDRYSAKTNWSKYWKKLWHRSKICGRNSMIGWRSQTSVN